MARDGRFAAPSTVPRAHLATGIGVPHRGKPPWHRSCCWPECHLGTTSVTTAEADKKVDSSSRTAKSKAACDESCKVQSYCEGTVEIEANCKGKCQSTCTGECKGICTASDGTKTDNNPNCHGKCSSTCNGKCKGMCKVEMDVGIACGTDVRCKGECTTTHTDPVCETTYTPPKCTVDASCQQSCSASVAAKAVCDPPHVELYANATVNADVPKLIATVNANLPALLGAAEVRGKLAFSVAEKLVTTGNAILQASGSLDGKSIACSVAAAKTAVEASASLSVSVSASTNVNAKCSSNAN